MKILVVHNKYGRLSGEEVVVQNIQKLLMEKGHDVINYFRESAELESLVFGSFRAFISGIYNYQSIRDLKDLLKVENPDIVHIHNVYPIISPAILPALKKAGIPVVMTVHNYRLICPNGLFLKDGKVCEKCSGGKEYNCIINNCEKNVFKSLGYAIRNYVARKKKYYSENVSFFACLTEFQKSKILSEGYPEEKLRVISNISDSDDEAIENTGDMGKQVGFIGRISHEKGIDTLIDASKILKKIPFRAAGSIDRMPEALNLIDENFGFSGHLDKKSLFNFTQKCRIIVLPTLCYEGFPTVIVEAMLHGKPVICSRIGGLPEIVDEGVTGLLFEPGNSMELAEKIQYLWEHPEICEEMGKSGRARAMTLYSSSRYYASIVKMYHEAIAVEMDPVE